jgi:hypothetical protein
MASNPFAGVRKGKDARNPLFYLFFPVFQVGLACESACLGIIFAV